MKDFITIASGDLKVTLLTPHSPFYNRGRFNHAGFVSGVSYKGVVFSAPEGYDAKRGTGGIGLCSAYFDHEPEQAAALGETYLRFGVGIAEKVEKPYLSMDGVKIEPYEITTDVREDSVIFTSKPPKVNDYCFEELRVVKVQGDTLTIQTTFKNTGDKPIHEREYNHNFVLLGDHKTGPQYTLDLPSVKNLTIAPSCPVLEQKGSGVTWNKDITEGSFFNQFDDIKAEKTDYYWKLSLEGTPLSMLEKGDFLPEHLTVWGVAHCISSEVFVEFSVKPGESASWTRQWVFSA
ncbi:MAG: hypothetical protein LBD02_08655 [Christensenellaceae bacterium]|jgi:hypothetical protein|nr:hypothetical protein [Christensenellaceae bacterium]